MYSESDLTIEVRKEIEQRLAAGRTTAPEWICHAVLEKHPFPKVATIWKSSDDKDLWYLAGYGFVRSLVRNVLRDFKERTDAGKGARSPGFKLLQQAYLIERKVAGKSVQRIVPLRKMSHAEGLAKYFEIRAMGLGCFAHCDELARYFGFTPDELKGAAA